MTTTPEAPAKTLTQLVALEIRFEMVRQDVLQSQLARSIGKTEQWLSVRLRGRQPIDVNDLALIARGLNVPFHSLIPDPEITAAATVEPTLRYEEAPERTTPATRRPPDNRPSGRSAPDYAPGVPRTGRIPRSNAHKRP